MRLAYANSPRDCDATTVLSVARGLRAVAVAVKVHAPSALPLLRQLIDPRGRCNRQAFLYIALAFLALQASVAAVLWVCGIEVGTEATLMLNAPIFWIGTTVCIKRLHDIGRRGWWLPGAFAIWFASAFVIATIVSMILGPEALAEGQPVYLAMFAAICLPALAALLWLHTSDGMNSANAFGPLPTGLGLSIPRSGYRRRPARTFYAASALS